MSKPLDEYELYDEEASDDTAVEEEVRDDGESGGAADALWVDALLVDAMRGLFGLYPVYPAYPPTTVIDRESPHAPPHAPPPPSDSVPPLVSDSVEEGYEGSNDGTWWFAAASPPVLKEDGAGGSSPLAVRLAVRLCVRSAGSVLAVLAVLAVAGW